MSRLDVLNVFVNDRLTAAGEEIIRAVRDALVEYQREILRSKEENDRLRRLLNVAMQRLLQQQQQQQQQEEEEEEEDEEAELSMLQPLDDSQRCERMSSMECLFQVKEEPDLRRTHAERLQEQRDSEEECSITTESPVLQPEDVRQPREGMSSVQLLPRVKEERSLGNITADCSHVAKMSEEGKCSQSELLQRLRPPPAETVSSRHTVSSTQLTQIQDKTEGDRKQPLADSSASFVSSDTESGEAQKESCSRAAQSDRTQRPERPVKGSLRSNGKQNAHVLQIKNVRSLRSPLPRPTLPSQGIKRWHSCEECGKGFSFACQLEVHMRWHTKEKPYSCTVCRKSFTTVSMLKRHHRIHTGEKPFRCHVCGKCFNQSAHLNTHFRLHTRERASWNRTPHSK